MSWYSEVSWWTTLDWDLPSRARENFCPGHSTDDSVNQPSDTVDNDVFICVIGVDWSIIVGDEVNDEVRKDWQRDGRVGDEGRGV